MAPGPCEVRPRFDGDRVYVHDAMVLTVIGGNTQESFRPSEAFGSLRKPMI